MIETGERGERMSRCPSCGRSFSTFIGNCPFCSPASTQPIDPLPLSNISLAIARDDAKRKAEIVAGRLFWIGIALWVGSAALIAAIYEPHGWTAASLVLAYVIALFSVILISSIAPAAWYNHLVELDARRRLVDVVQGPVLGRYKQLPSGEVASFLALSLSFGWNLTAALMVGCWSQKDVDARDVVETTIREHFNSDAGPRKSYWDMSSEERMYWEMQHPETVSHFLRVGPGVFKVDIADWYRVAENDIVRVHVMRYCRTVLGVHVVCRFRPEVSDV